MNQEKVDWLNQRAFVGAFLNFRRRHHLSANRAAPFAPMSHRHLHDLETFHSHASDTYLLRLLSIMDVEAILEMKTRLADIKVTHQSELVLPALAPA